MMNSKTIHFLVVSFAVSSVLDAQTVFDLPSVVAGWDFDTNDLGALFDASQTENIVAQVPFSRQGSRINTSALYQNQGAFMLDLGEGPFELEYSNFNLQQVNVEGIGGNPTSPLDSSNYIFARGFEVEPSDNNGMILFRGRNSGNVIWDDFGVTGPERGDYFDIIVPVEGVVGMGFAYDVSPLTVDWQKINTVSVSVDGGDFEVVYMDDLTSVPVGTWVTRELDLSGYDGSTELTIRYTFVTSETADDDSPFGLAFDNIGVFDDFNIAGDIFDDAVIVSAEYFALMNSTDWSIFAPYSEAGYYYSLRFGPLFLAESVTVREAWFWLPGIGWTYFNQMQPNQFYSIDHGWLELIDRSGLSFYKYSDESILTVF